MVNVWVVSRVGNVITLNDGGEIDLDSFPGNGWTTSRCANITESLQENHVDNVVDRDALSADDPDKTATEAELAAVYGGWFVELNTKGNSNEIRLRHTVVTVFPINGGADFNVRWEEVSR